MSREDNLLGKWIAILHRYRKNYVNRQLESYGLSGEQFIILLALSHHDGASQEEISGVLKIDKTTTAKAIKRLEGSNYICRTKNSSDARAYHVFLTQKALTIIPLIRQTVKNWEQEVTFGFSKEEYRAMEAALQRMAENACRLCSTE